MKNIKPVLILLLLIVSKTYSLDINQYTDVQDVSQKVKVEISKIIGYPVEAAENGISGEVQIVFVVDSQGHLIVLNAFSESEILKKYVVDQLNHRDINNLQLDSGTKYKIVITFELKN